MSNVHPIRPPREDEAPAQTGRPANENMSSPSGLVPPAPVYSDWLRKEEVTRPGLRPQEREQGQNGAASYFGYAVVAAMLVLLAYTVAGTVVDWMGPVTVGGQD
ncbi:hypothetical protein [Aureimonas altamirensis]|uniref:hypothetical protein n=1 Tax=Aureimonas altamirensis TaxID=370622 RepID=UPI00057EF279|nr:hypothetical protein [Aureimonas altamirensis]